MLESTTAQVGVDFQDVLPGSVHAGDYGEFLFSKLLSPPTLRSALLKQYRPFVNFSVNNLLSHRACR
jgi:hypothetical protein